MISKVEFVPAVFKFRPSEGFGENISRLFLRRNEFYFNSVVLYFLTGVVIVDFKVFGFFMENWVVTKFYTTLIVTIKMSWFFLQKSKFLKQSSNPNGFA